MTSLPIKITSGIDVRAFTCAEQFFNAANDIDEFKCINPYIVNLSFAIELFIKSLDITREFQQESEGSPFFSEIAKPKVKAKVRGHSLYEMYKKLPEQLRGELVTTYKVTNERDLNSDLQEIKDAFLNYRYVYEKQSVSVNMTALKLVSKFLYEFIQYRTYC